jgi:hypothetical protein
VVGDLGTVVPVLPVADGVPGPVLVDAGGVVADRYGIGHDGTALIRPDGYLGYLATHTSADALAGHLASREHLLV